MKIQTNKKAFVLVASIVLALFLAVLLGAALSRTQIQLQESISQISSQQAFYAAEAGLQRAVFELRRSPLWNGFTTNQTIRTNNTDSTTSVGSYNIQVKTTADFNNLKAVWVKSNGSDSSGRFNRSILAKVIVESPTAFFISTAGNIHLGSGSNFTSNLLGQDIYFDVNGSLPADQQSIVINGDVDYLGHVYNATDPHVTITGQTVQFPSVTFAGVDLDRYRALAQPSNGGQYTSGNLEYHGDISMGNLGTSNGLVFAEGDIRISGDIKDSMLFVAGKNIYIDGNIVAQSSNPDNVPQLGLLAKRDVIIPTSAPSNLTVNAFVMADGGEGSLGGILVAQGEKYTKDTITFNGAMSLRAQNNAWTAADLNVYKHRNYTYNTQLNQDRQIPFLPFIANVIQWSEVLTSDPMPTN